MMRAFAAAALIACLGLAAPSRAEMNEIAVGHEYGMAYLPYLVMEHDHLVEKHAQKQGLAAPKVTWNTFGGSGFMQDALLGGRIQFASSGVPWFLTLWSKTGGTVKSLGALCAMPLYLNSRNPRLRTIHDYTDKDRIALPAIKSSTQAMVLQMAAAQAFGRDQAHRFDTLTVALNHADGMAMLLAGANEIESHLTSPPFQEIELKDPRIHKVLDSYDVMGGPASFIIGSTTIKFHEENPKTYAAFSAALSEAQEFINAHKEEASRIYVEMSGDKGLSRADVLALLNDPQIRFTTTPQNVTKWASFMHEIGAIRSAPGAWQDLFFPDRQSEPGS
jgi:NitT/TauT family transport system substrate-binding protein